MSDNRHFLRLVGMMRSLFIEEDEMQFPPVGPAPGHVRTFTDERPALKEEVTILSTLRKVGRLEHLPTEFILALNFCIELELVKSCQAWSDDGHGPFRDGTCFKLTTKGEDQLARLEGRALKKSLARRILFNVLYWFFETRTARAVSKLALPPEADTRPVYNLNERISFHYPPQEDEPGRGRRSTG